MIVNVRPGGSRSSLMATMMAQTGTTPLSAHGEETLKADSRAFRALMRHIREVDAQHTVIMMQVENESGVLGDSRDRSQMAEAAWARPVPAHLMNYLTRNRATLRPELQQVWGRNGNKPSGTWTEVFGTDEWADEVFMAYYMGHFMGEVARDGKAELNIPMYANAWLGPQPGQDLPGQYPSGGPVARVMDVYKAAAPSLDLTAPDIYVQDFKGAVALYSRSDNPLLVPEARDQVGNLFWSLGRHGALGWSPFGIEDLNPQGQVAQAYGLLSEMLPQLAGWEAEGKVRAILMADGEQAEPAALGGYKITLRTGFMARSAQGAGPAAPNASAELAGGISLTSRAMPNDTRPFAIVVNTAPDEFLFIGSNGDPSFAVDSSGPSHVAISSRDEGRYFKGKWMPGRRLNGDEVYMPGLPSSAIGMLKVQLVRFD
jgi:hypothetical protein